MAAKISARVSRVGPPPELLSGPGIEDQKVGLAEQRGASELFHTMRKTT